ncbi:hypothetical protein DH2020_024088 [Rehmannia glutinosa]|uniref:Uncharacterized protein n=1 Tax=Rehmannia glutinosa TaxID=99300 RepID=A0ABR0WC32_REHGL
MVEKCCKPKWWWLVSRSDDRTASKFARNKSFVNNNGHDLGRSFSSDRITSSYSRRSSSSNGSSHLSFHSSFGRNQHDRDWEKDTYDFRNKDKSVLRDHRPRDFSDARGNMLLSKFKRDGLDSHSMVYGTRGGTWHKKVVTEPSTNSGNDTSDRLTKVSLIGEVKKVAFERDFPSLGAEERAVNAEVKRVPSPGLTSAVPIGSSTITSGEKWTSALAQVPVSVGSNGTGIPSVQQAAPSSSTSVALGTTTNLNMAEAVAQGPSRAQSTTQVSVGTQRLEELAIKQSRQLIPVTPSLPKTMALNSSDKQKNKVGQQQHPISSSPLVVNQSPRGGPVKSEFSKASNMGKLHVLKPVRERNGAVKDNLSPTNGSKPASSPIAAVNSPVSDRKPVLTVLEKKPTSQSKSRNDFFNSVRKNSMANSSSVLENDIVVLPSFPDKLTETVAVGAPNTSQVGDASSDVSLSGDHLSETKGDLTCNGDACDVREHAKNGKKHSRSDPIFSEEEEAAFLRSLGWEENAEEGGLTDEEISAFFKDVTKYINSKPYLKILQVQLLPFESQIGLNSSDAKLES